MRSDAPSAHALDLVVDLDGNVTVVWAEYTGGFNTFGIWAARYTTGGGWGAAVPLEDQGSGDARRPRVDVDPAGRVTAVWQERETQDSGVPSHIWSARYVPGGGWTTPVLIENAEESAGLADVAVDPNGNAIAVWQQANGSANDIWSNRYTPGAGWDTAMLVEQEAGDARAPLVVVDADGIATVAWLQPDGLWRSIAANRYSPSEGWGTPALVAAVDREDADYHSIAADPAGRVTVVWRQHGQTGNAIWSNRYLP